MAREPFDPIETIGGDTIWLPPIAGRSILKTANLTVIRRREEGMYAMAAPLTTTEAEQLITMLQAWIDMETT